MTLLVLEVLAKATLVLLVAAVADRVMLRRASAAARHFVWTMAVGALLALPILAVAIPRLTIPVRVPAARLASNRAGDPAPATIAAGEGRAASTTAVASSPADVAPIRQSDADVPVRSRVSVVLWIGALYLAGMLFFLARLAVAHGAAGRLARRAHDVTDPEWLRLLTDSARQVGVTRPVRLLRGAEYSMPMALGARRAIVVLPSIAGTWTEDRRRAVLLHELAHVARRDCLTQMGAAVACAMYWPHPGVWYAARRMRVERELACDDRVLAIATDGRSYAEHLLDVAYTLGGSRALALAVSMARRHHIEGRLLAALDAARDRSVPALRRRVAGIVLAATIVVPLAAADAAFVPVDAPIAQTASAPASQPRLPGTWEIRPSTRTATVELRLNESAHSSSSFTIALDRLEGPSPTLLSGAGGAATFSIRRDAGTFAFEGTFRSGVGAGTYTFTPSATFPADLVKRGFARPTPDDQYRLARGDIGFAFLDELKAQGYARPELPSLVSASDHGVDLEYVRGMARAGYHLGQIDALVRQRDHGVTPAFIADLSAAGLRGLSADDLVRARDHGVSPDYIGGLDRLGYKGLTLDALVAARDHGISPQFVTDLQALGYAKLTLAELVNARDHGVSAEYIRALNDLGYRSLSLADLIRLRDHGVTPEYAKAHIRAGQPAPTVDQLIQSRDRGGAGPSVTSLDDLQRRISIYVQRVVNHVTQHWLK